MPTTAPTKASLSRVLKRTIKALGLTHPDFPDSDQVIQGSPLTRTNIRDAVLQADNDFCLIILDDPYHPYKSIFYTEDPAELATGAYIQSHLGNHTKVTIKVSTSPDVFKRGRLARNLDHVRKVQSFPAIYGDPRDLYWIESNVIEHTGIMAKVFTASYNIDRTSGGGEGACQSPASYENGIYALSVASLYMSGQDLSHRQHYLNLAQEYKDMARRRITSMPEPEIHQRVAA